MAMNENGGRRRASAMTALSWLVMGLVFLGLAVLQIHQQGLGGDRGALAIDLVVGLSGLGIAWLTWRSRRR